MACLTQYGLSYWQEDEEQYLPQVGFQSHTTIQSRIFKTSITQTFVNLTNGKNIETVWYTFPLLRKEFIESFTCHIGDRVITGKVEERPREETDEREIEFYDMFSALIGSVPAGAIVRIEIAHIGRLTEQPDKDGAEFRIFAAVGPRWSADDAESMPAQVWKGLEIHVDVVFDDVPGAKPQISSPSHKITVEYGQMPSGAGCAMGMSSAPLTALDRDFVLQLAGPAMRQPVALLETHPTLPGHRALMLSMVVDRTKPSVKPAGYEFVLMLPCNQKMFNSGGVPSVIESVHTFLKSLQPDDTFNVCLYGSSYKFMYESSGRYERSKVFAAQEVIEELYKDDLGAETNMLEPLRDVIKRREKGRPLKVLLLIDSEIGNRDELLDYLGKVTAKDHGTVSVFPVGLDSKVNAHFIKDVAKVGKGLTWPVEDGETVSEAVVQTLRHIRQMSSNDSDPRIVAVPRHKWIRLFDWELSSRKYIVKKPSSDADPDPAVTILENIKACILLPKESGSGSGIPIWLLLHDGGCSVPILIPITPPPDKIGTGDTIHKFAARRELEAMESTLGCPPDKMDNVGRAAWDAWVDFADREAVRLGVTFQVRGKSCPFVTYEQEQEVVGQQQKQLRRPTAIPVNIRGSHSPPKETAEGARSSLQRLILMQSLDGHWDMDRNLLDLLEIPSDTAAQLLQQCKSDGILPRVGTALAVDFIYQRWMLQKAQWFLMVEKADAFINAEPRKALRAYELIDEHLSEWMVYPPDISTGSMRTPTV